MLNLSARQDVNGRAGGKIDSDLALGLGCECVNWLLAYLSLSLLVANPLPSDNMDGLPR